MNVTATCGGCGKTYAAGANLYGKTVKCRKCGATFRVPAPAPAARLRAGATASAANATTTQATAAQDPQDLYTLAGGDDDGVAVAPAPVAHGYRPNAAATGASLPLMTPSGRILPEAAQRALRGEFVEPDEPSGINQLLTPEAQWILMACAVGLPIFLALMALAAPQMQGFALAVVFTVGLALLLWGYLGVLVVASAEGGYHAVLAFVTGVYWFVYAVTRWDETRPHVSRYGAGVLLVFVGLGVLGVDAYRESARRAAAAAAAAPAVVVPDQGMKNIAEQADARAAAALAGADRSEARAWLATDPRTEEGEPIELDGVRSATDGLYAAGASQVFVVRLRAAVSFGLPPQLVAVLPTDPAARQRIFEWQFQRAYEDDTEPEVDVGQKYLVIDVDGFSSLLD